jgi:hypothetical protein
MLKSNNIQVDCNTEKSVGAIANCTQPLQPKLSLVPDINNYQSCRGIMDPSFQYADKIVPSYCTLSSEGRELGCEEDPITGEMKIKVAYDVITPQFPNDPALCPPPDQITEELTYDDFGKCSKGNNMAVIIVLMIFMIIFLLFLFFIYKYYKRKS